MLPPGKARSALRWPGSLGGAVSGRRRDSRSRIDENIGLSCVPFLSIVACGGPLVAIVAIVLGAVVRRDIDARGGLTEDRTRAQTGMYLGIAGLVLYVVLVIVGLVLGLGVSLLETY